MRRWHAEQQLMLRRWRQELANHDWEIGQRYPHCYLAPPSDAVGIDCHCAHGIGTMRKRTPHGCRSPRCWLCHSEKLVPKARMKRKLRAIEFELNAY